MTDHEVGTREDWLTARRELLAAEKEHTRRGDELARQRRELPWVPVEKEHAFDTEDGRKTLPELFDGRSQLMIYHFMFGPDYEAGCPACSAIADGFNGFVPHLAHRAGVTMLCVSRAPLDKLLAYRERMGWTFPWVSSFESDFNYDFATSRTVEELRVGGEYNYERYGDLTPLVETESGPVAENAARAGTTPERYLLEAPGMSAFALSDGVVYHTYSAYARGLDALWGAYQWLDRAPLGRNEEGSAASWQRRDEYESATAL
jgi:predicted dithiol-disulfide oxidoreductase (DUF899 family)